MLNAGKNQAAGLQPLDVSKSMLDRLPAGQCREVVVGVDIRCEEAKKLMNLENQNGRLELLVADQALDIQMLNHLSGGNWQALPGR